MRRSIALVSLVVADYDEAIAFYVGSLGFDLLEDTPISPGQRWVVVAPPGPYGCRLLLAKATDAPQGQAIGMQAGGRVFLFLNTDDFWRDHALYLGRGVHFLEEPRREAYGTVAKFTDLYGNPWDLIEPAAPSLGRPAGGPADG